jgi:hypothetical protein
MTTHLPVLREPAPTLFKDKSMLPTGKYHVSYSEVSTASGPDGCAWKHKLKYIDGHEEGDTEHTTYGRTLHSALQEWLLEGDSVWFDWDDRIEQCQKEVVDIFESINFKPTQAALHKDWVAPVASMLSMIPKWMDETFPAWKPVAAEIYLFEPVAGHTNKWFKGFIDAVIKVPKQPRKGSKKEVSGFLYWILDWKTTSWGWDARKKQDKYKRMQLALYKHYLSIKLDIPLEDIRCGFVLLKRTAKNGDHLELIEVSVGDKTREEAVNLVSECISLIAKKFWMKNRNACRFCPFQNTPLCP